MADKDYSAAAALADKTWTQAAAIAEGTYQLAEATRLAGEADALAAGTPTALNIFNAQYAHARADWVALVRYDYADYWTARADADSVQRAAAAAALADYDTALADARVGYTTTVAAAVAARQVADAQSDADYATGATERAGAHSVAVTGAENVLRTARAVAVGDYLAGAAEADRVQQVALAQNRAEIGNGGIAYQRAHRDYWQAVVAIAAPYNTQAWYDAELAARQTRDAALSQADSQWYTNQNAANDAHAATLANLNIPLVATQADANVVYATATAAADAAALIGEAADVAAWTAQTTQATKTVSDAVAEATRTLRYDDADAQFAAIGAANAATLTAANDSAEAAAEFFRAQYAHQSTAMTAFDAAVNTPLSQYLADRAPIWATWADSQAAQFTNHVSDLADLGSGKTLELAALSRDNSRSVADTVRDAALDYYDLVTDHAAVMSQATLEYLASVSSDARRHRTAVAIAERDYAVRIAELERDAQLSGQQWPSTTDLNAAAAEREAAVAAALKAYGVAEITATADFRTELARGDYAFRVALGDLDRIRQIDIALENEAFWNDLAEVRHDWATELAELQIGDDVGRAASRAAAEGEVHRQFASIWSQERASVADAENTRASSLAPHRTALAAERADADRTRDLADAARERQMVQSRAQGDSDYAQELADITHGKALGNIEADLTAAAAGGYQPWALPSHSEAAPIQAHDVDAATFAASMPRPTDGYFAGAVSSMFGWVWTGYPSSGYVTSTTAEEGTLNNRVNDAADRTEQSSPGEEADPLDEAFEYLDGLPPKTSDFVDSIDALVDHMQRDRANEAIAQGKADKAAFDRGLSNYDPVSGIAFGNIVTPEREYRREQDEAIRKIEGMWGNVARVAYEAHHFVIRSLGAAERYQQDEATSVLWTRNFLDLTRDAAFFMADKLPFYSRKPPAATPADNSAKIAEGFGVAAETPKKPFGPIEDRVPLPAASKVVPAVTIVERDGSVVRILIKSGGKSGTAIADLSVDGNRIVLKGLHIDGDGAGSLGQSTLREACRELGRQHGVEFVDIYGGVRTTGANVGKLPVKITIRVTE